MKEDRNMKSLYVSGEVQAVGEGRTQIELLKGNFVVREKRLILS